MINLLSNFAATCKQTSFFGIPTWYKYLPQVPEDIKGVIVKDAAGKDVVAQICKINIQYNNLTDYLLIGFGIIDILLRLSGLVAVVFVIIGGVQYVLSQGEPENTKKALSTIINALIGLAIAVLGAAIVPFIAKAVGA